MTLLEEQLKEDKMAEGILKFDLNDSDDRMAHLRAVKSLDLALTLWDMEQYLRSKTKYAPDSMSTETFDAFETARTELYDIMNSRGISLDDLIN